MLPARTTAAQTTGDAASLAVKPRTSRLPRAKTAFRVQRALLISRITAVPARTRRLTVETRNAIALLPEATVPQAAAGTWGHPPTATPQPTTPSACHGLCAAVATM